MQGRDKRRYRLASVGGEDIAVGFLNLFDQAVSPEQTYLSGDGPRLMALLFLAELLVRRVKDVAQVTIAEAIDAELTTSNSCEERKVFGSVWIYGPHSFFTPDGGLA